MDTYSVEIRTGGSNYRENHYDFNTSDEVKDFIKKLKKSERIHSVLLYPDGTTSNPKDVTSKFKR
jgi:hypothetical protein